jgi:type II secretory pathway component GspD/PulD (secretin)
MICAGWEGAFSADAEKAPVDTAISQMTGRLDATIDLLDLKNMDIMDVLKLISEKSRLNIVAGTNVSGKVTIYLKDVEVRNALRIILTSNNLAYEEDGNVIRIMPAKDFEQKYGYPFGVNMQTLTFHLRNAHMEDILPVLEQVKSPSGKIISDSRSNTLILTDSQDKLAEIKKLLERIDVPMETKIFELNYAEADEMAKKLDEILTPRVGRIKSDEASGKIIVRDTSQKLAEISRVIEAFDIREQEVAIEAKIIQITLSDQHKLGVDWQAIVAGYHGLNVVSDFDVLNSLSKKGQLGIGTLSDDNYEVLIEALQETGLSNILSSPKITTMNNKEAKILVGSTEPYVTTTTTTPASGPTQISETVNFIDVGVKLYVTPTIHKDGFITMKIKPEVSSVTRTLTTSNNNTVPIIDTSEAETTVMIKDGITIMIGGLIKDEKVDSFKKVPILGDIPLIGLAFQNQDKLKRKSEIVIFLTPRIISGDVPAKEIAELESSENVKKPQLDLKPLL